MGRGMLHADQDLTFAKEISESSKRTALGKSVHLDTKRVTSLRPNTKSNKLTLEPITAAVSTNSKIIDEKSHPSSSLKDVFELERPASRRILPSLTLDNGHDDALMDDVSGNGTKHLAVTSKDESNFKKNNSKVERKKNPKAFTSAMSKHTYMPPRTVHLDENVFTFRPKVSSASNKIAESLGTDFMSRQQMHIEKQRKLLEQSSQYTRFSLSLPQSQRQQEAKESENKNSSAQKRNFDADNGEKKDHLSARKERSNKEAADQEDIALPSQPLLMDAASLNTPSTESQPLHGVSAGDEAVTKKKKQTAWFPGSESLPKRKLTPECATDKENELSRSLTRSKTIPMLNQPRLKSHPLSDGERLRAAKEMVDKAIKCHKVFTIQGGYSSIRHSLRERGWVEKFYKIPSLSQKTSKPTHQTSSDDDDDDDDNENDGNDDGDDDTDDDDDDDDDDNDQPQIPPWEEEDGFYGIMNRADLIRMSRMLKNVSPSLFWVLKRDAIDHRYLNKDQLVNHYSKAGSFTTKVGLCTNIRNVPWFEPVDPDQFFLRCYRLSHDEEKQSFIDDFRHTACMNILKIVNKETKNGYLNEVEREDKNEDGTTSGANTSANKDPCSKESVCQNTEHACSQATSSADNSYACVQNSDATLEDTTPVDGNGEQKTANTESTTQFSDPAVLGTSRLFRQNRNRIKKRNPVPSRILELAIQECERFLGEREHEDIDRPVQDELSESQWEDFIKWYYVMAHEDGMIPAISQRTLTCVESLINRLRTKCPQFEMDGTHNVWIVKPGAKSRGRGIFCYNRLEEMLKLVNSQVVKKDGKYVVQKYMERPLLIYNTKFDIRQWFLVTDWSPLTVWFYQESYLRFCSRQFTLENFDQSIHLSNNAIQKYCRNGPRSKLLPDENMWTHEQFKDYLSKKKMPHAWDEIIYPGMKQAIICSLLCAQDLVECRKSSFELYGADFMLTEDFQPWLIEINSSPSMEASTSVTAKLCHKVLDDTIKVVIDRRSDKNCDVGSFELAYKQPLVTVPPYIGMSMCVEGQGIRKQGGVTIRKNIENYPTEPLFTSKSFRPLNIEKGEECLTKKGSSTPLGCSSTGNRIGTATRKDTSDNPGPTHHLARSVAFENASKNRSDNVNWPVRGEGKSFKTGRTYNSDNPNPTHHLARSVVFENASKNRSDIVNLPVRGDGKSFKTGRTYNSGDIGQSDHMETARMSPEKRTLSAEITSVSKPACVSSPLFNDLGNKRFVSRTSVSSNYPTPGSQNTTSTVRSSLAVNNVENTVLRMFKPSKGRRHHRKPAYFGGLRYTHNSVPHKLSPYAPASSVRKLPPVKVHVINAHLDSSPSVQNTTNQVV
ncbi:tubulin glycylase 3C-like isoform X4 [Pomacea canaliculata]|uniref:tubulin glycylase 3C-like isoform X4 n=1 Tax=Pomacea canaliculata TaxID=400727 RepID=UPI000D73D023|nr:tubulin glycylase 3C-like isoform X4 [Pomacea canaliculata]